MNQSKCPICESLPRGPLCKTHRQELAKTIHGLKLGMHDLKRMELREIRFASHGGGAAHPAFAPTPIDISAATLYDQVEDTIQDVAGDIGLWGGKAPQLLAKLAARMGRLADAPNSARDYRQLTNALHRIKLRTTPPQDRIIHGHCLNPECGAQLVGLPDDTIVTCHECGSTWAAAEIRRARREMLTGRTITGTPTQIARWVKQTTGAPAKAQNVKDWLRRGQVLAVSRPKKGVYECEMGSMLAAVEDVHPGVKLTA